MYWETGVKGRKPFRKYFHGWKRAYQNVMFWAKTKRDVYMSVYGFKELIYNGRDYNYLRNVLPDYDTVVVDKIFLDIDMHDKDGEDVIMSDVLSIEKFLDGKNIRRRWVFSGGGFHCLIKAEGNSDMVDNGVFYMMGLCDKASVDEGVFDIQRVRRVPGTFNKKRGLWCINISLDDIDEGLDYIREIAKRRRFDTFPVGEEALYLDELPDVDSPRIRRIGARSSVRDIGDRKEVLDMYGLDWDVDFCDTMKAIIMKESVSNFERLQLIRYLRCVVCMPYVDCENKKLSVPNFLYNILEDKSKASHCVRMMEAEAIYRRGRVFHPYKLKKLGYCPEDCEECLVKRYGNGY